MKQTSLRVARLAALALACAVPAIATAATQDDTPVEAAALRCSAISQLHSTLTVPSPQFGSLMGDIAGLFAQLHTTQKNARTKAKLAPAELKGRREAVLSEIIKGWPGNKAAVIQDAATCNAWRIAFFSKLPEKPGEKEFQSAMLNVAPGLSALAAPEDPSQAADVLPEHERLLGRMLLLAPKLAREHGAEFTINAAHESGVIGYLQLGSVAKANFPNSHLWTAVAAIGYRWGHPEGWHYGVGLAQELFPGAEAKDAPRNPFVDPTDTINTRFDTQFAVIELGYGAIEARYLHVLSKDFRGNNTAVVCGARFGPEIPLYLASLADPSAAIACYGDGVQPDARVQLHAHAGRVGNLPAGREQDLSPDHA